MKSSWTFNERDSYNPVECSIQSTSRKGWRDAANRSYCVEMSAGLFWRLPALENVFLCGGLEK